MNDKLETDLAVILRTEVDEASAKEAPKKLRDAVLRALKNGYIEIPAAISKSFEGNKVNDKLIKAQKDFIDQWEKMSKEGFSSSGKELNSFINKYIKLKRLIGENRQGQSKQNLALNEIKLGSLLNAYKTVKKELKVIKKETQVSTNTNISNVKSLNTKVNKKQDKRYKGLDKIGPKEPKGGWINPDYTNPHEARNSEISAYVVPGTKQPKKTKDEIKAKELASLKVKKYRKDMEIKGNNSYKLTPFETATEQGRIIKEEIVPKIIQSIRKKDDSKVDDLDVLTNYFFDAIDASTKLSLKASKSMIKEVRAILDPMMKNTGFSVNGKIGGTNGEDKDAISRQAKIERLFKGFLDRVNKLEDRLIKEEIARADYEDELIGRKTKKRKTSGIVNVDSYINKLIAEARNNRVAQEKNEQALNKKMSEGTDATKTQTAYDKIENVAERQADAAESQKNQTIIENLNADLGTGFNTDAMALQLIDEVHAIGTICVTISDVLKNIFKNGIKGVGDTRKKNKTILTKTELDSIFKPLQQSMLLPPAPERLALPAPQSDVPKSTITTTRKNPNSIFTKIIDAFEKLTGVTANYRVIMAKTSEEQDALNAERINTFGLMDGDKIKVARRLSLFKGKDFFKDLFGNINLSEGIRLDTTAVTDSISKALSGAEMFKAQSGGWLRNIAGAMTGGLAFAFQPSLEKTRAQADIINTVMANMRTAVNTLTQDILDKESALRGMKKSGALKTDEQGNVLDTSTSEAKALAAEYEKVKKELASVLADVGAVDVVVKRTHGRIPSMLKQLGFTSTILRKNNILLANGNAGLDKNGKALKYQTRLAEILNYSFQLMGRYIGQLVKRSLLMLNPLTYIKKLFNDFMGYNTKWQRTMNVIKYNIRTIVKPAMEWIAQKIVNLIGFVDIISMKIQEALGRVPISLFDQAAADAEKIEEELEAAANVTAGFDELHDIGSDNSGANDLLGEIYKPQLSEKWKKLASEIGDLFAGLIKGDLGFGEVATRILKILGQLLSNIASDIWDWFKKTSIGKWITEKWKNLLDNLLKIFVGWQLLKIAGKLIWNALLGGTSSGGVLGTLGSKLIAGLSSLFKSGGLVGIIKAGGASLGTILGTALTAAAGVAIGVGGIAYFGNKADKNSAYNIGLMNAGGKESDKKSNLGNGIGATLLGAGGGALAGLAIGGLPGAAIGAAIGAIAGILRTTLSPVLQEIEVNARNMNNELQKIEFYEGQVQGAQTQVSIYDEQLKLLKQSLTDSTQAVYKQGEQLGISKTRMNELVTATQNGTFTTNMLTGSEVGLASSLTNLAQKQNHVTEVTNRLEEAQKKLLKAQTELSIAQDIEAGNFEIAAARIEVAEMQGVYTTEEATKKRIQLYKEGSKEERDNLLQNLTNEQTTRMAEYLATTNEGLGKLSKAWRESSEDTRKAIYNSVGPDIQRQLDRNMNSMDAIIKQHTSFWQKAFDTTLEVLSSIFTFGLYNPTTWTYNANDKYYEEAAKQINQNPDNASLYDEATLAELKRRKLIRSYAIGTNYVPSDGLAYLHQGEAVIPKKYNTPYQSNNTRLENAIDALTQQVMQISTQVNQGINVHGQFIQKGSDLVATVQKASNKLSNNVLNNKVYAR